MKILSVDSTSKNLSISISDGNEILSEIIDKKSEKHMQNIIFDIDKAFKSLPFKINDIDIFAVNLGPGDFTGSRIGISVIKIFSMLSGKKAYGYNALDVFAVSSLIKSFERIKRKIKKSEKVFIIPLMDVRNHEIFASIYETKYYPNDDILLSKKSKPYFGYSNTDRFKTIFTLEEFNESFMLEKIYGNILIKKDDFIDKFYMLLNQLKTLNSCSFASCSSIFEKKDYKKNGIFNFVLAGNAYYTYKDLFESLIEKFGNKKNIKIYVQKANKYPEAKYVNLLAQFDIKANSSNNTNIVPFYVRDFIPFKK